MLMMSKNIKYLLDIEDDLYIPTADYTRIKGFITDINRSNIVKWLNDLRKFLNYDFYTFNLTITLLDAYFSLDNTDETNMWQCISVMCFDIASSVTRTFQPDISDYSFYTDGAYDAKDFVNAKLKILSVLKCQIIRPTPSFFLSIWLNHLFISTNMNYNERKEKRSFLEKFENPLLMLSLCISELMIYKASSIASAIYFILIGEEYGSNTTEVTDICIILHSTIMNVEDSLVSEEIKYIIVDFRAKMDRNCPHFIKLIINKKENHKNPKIINDYLPSASEKIKLGAGTFSEVFKVKIRDKNYAAKFYEFNEMEYPGDIVNELAILSLLSETNRKKCETVSFEGFQIYKSGIFLFFELGEMNLEEFVIRNKFEKETFLKIYKNILEGVSCCHYNDIIHGDLKPPNIVWFSKTNTFKLIDFGSSIAFSSFRKDRIFEFTTPTYRAPEVFLEYKNFDHKIDIWAIGLILYFVVTGRTLLQGTASDICRIFGLPKEKDWPGVSNLFGWSDMNCGDEEKMFSNIVHNMKEYYVFAKPCLQLNPKNRPEAKTLLKCLNRAAFNSL